MLNKDDILHNRYRIINRLGEGGMGTVYQAVDIKRFNKPVALKEVLIELINNNSDQMRRAFEREAKILTQIEHEAVPKVIDYFLETDCQFLVMELIEGDDLTDILQKNRTWFPLEDVLNWANQLLDALDYLHSMNPPIVHRDIKPHNLKLTSRGKIKLLDFGIAKDTGSDLSVTLTDHTFVAATLHYSPFEQIIRLPFYYEPLHLLYGEKIDRFLQQSADARSDIYSLGATLYHLLTNVEPIGAYQRTLEVWAGKVDPLPPPHKLASHLSLEISTFLLKAMELDRENRYSSAAEMKTALRNIILEEKRRDYEADQALLFAEQEKLRQEREEIEAEKQRLQLEREETLRQIAAEVERQRLEKEEKERELQLFKEEQIRLQEIEYERQRLVEQEKIKANRDRLEAEAKEKELEKRRLEAEAAAQKEREELEATRRRLEAEKRWLKVQHEESLRQIAAERELAKREEEKKAHELEQLEKERQQLEKERLKLEAEIKQKKIESKRKKEPESKGMPETRDLASIETLKVIPAEETLQYNSAQMSPFVTQVENNFVDSAEESSDETEEKSTDLAVTVLPSEEIEVEDELLEIEAKPEEEVIVSEFDDAEIQDDAEIKLEKTELAVEPIAAAEIENSYTPNFSPEPQKKSARMFFVGIISLFVLAVSAFGIWMMSGKSKIENPVNSAESVVPTASPTAEPSVSPENEIMPTPPQITTEQDKPKPTVAPLQNKTPAIQNPVKTPPQKTPKPQNTPDKSPDCIYNGRCSN